MTLSTRTTQKKKVNSTTSHPRAERVLEEGRIQEVIDKLTTKQRIFCEEYMHDYNGSRAVERAGYRTKYPNRMAHQLLRHPSIRVTIDQLTLQRASTSVMKPEYVINKITRTIEKAERDDNHSVVLRGCELLARHLGMFIERQEISGPNGEAIKYEQVRQAADDFTSSIARLLERQRADEALIVFDTGIEGGTPTSLEILG